MASDMPPDVPDGWSDQRTSRLPIAIIPGAGGFSSPKDNLVLTCESHGETILIDYPEVQWHLENRDLPSVAKAMHAQVSRRMGRRPFVLAGASLGAIIAALIVQIDPDSLCVAKVFGLDPAGSLEQLGPLIGMRELGWLARNLARARGAGLGGSPSFFWVRFIRAIAIVVARWVRRGSRIARAVAWFLAKVGPAQFSIQLRMRLLIDATTAWRRSGARQCEEIIASEVPCTIFHTPATRLDRAFWQRHFDSVNVMKIEGDHDTWFKFGGPQLLVAEWEVASGRSVGREVTEA
jgi:pimeloyl-ACP methyl ester carboxylesterase